MTFLELVQALREECGVSASTAGASPSAVTNQSGEMRRLVNWTKRAWLSIQNTEDWWLWMASDFTVNTVAGTGSYLPSICNDVSSGNPITRFARWDKESFRLYRQSDGVADEQFLTNWDFNVFRDTYLFAGQRNQTNRPAVWAERPENRAILLGDVPDTVYVLGGRYQKSAQDLSADGDVPEMPSKFHMLIVYRAMEYYGKYESAPEILAQGQDEFEKMMSDLRREQLPEVRIGRPLA